MRFLFFISLLLLTLCFPSTSVAAQFLDNADGTVTDLGTGLIWQKQDDNTKRIWQGALSFCESLTLGGSSDWRLPNIKEIGSIVDYTTITPAIDSRVFVSASDLYWSATTVAEDTTGAWTMGFQSGIESYISKASPAYVRCIR